MLDAVRTQEFIHARVVFEPPSPSAGFCVHNPPRTVPSGRSGRPPAPAAPTVPPGGRARAAASRARRRSAPLNSSESGAAANARPCAGRVSMSVGQRHVGNTPAWRPKPRPVWHVSSTSRPPHASMMEAAAIESAVRDTPPRPCRNRNRASWCGYSSLLRQRIPRRHGHLQQRTPCERMRRAGCRGHAKRMSVHFHARPPATTDPFSAPFPGYNAPRRNARPAACCRGRRSNSQIRTSGMPCHARIMRQK